MKKLTLQESFSLTGKPRNFSADYWFDDACILDMDNFVKTLTGIKAKGVRPELIGSMITHYASKWVPELSSGDEPDKPSLNNNQESSNSISTSLMKKRFFLETLVGILPPEKDSIPCNLLLRLLRVANVVGVEPAYKAELEKRISWVLEEASLKEIMIPAFNYTCETVLDVELVLRLVKRYVNLEDAFKSAASMIKVAKLVDSYLAEATADANMKFSHFVGLAAALPPYARSCDDGLYRAIDTFLKAHPGASKQERKSLCTLIDSRKLSPEASLHAAQNERLPVRAVIQVLFSEQAKLNKQVDWSGSFSGTRSPNVVGQDPPPWCLSKREASTQSLEIKKLKEEIRRLQSRCMGMQVQIDRLLERKKGSFFNWKKIVMPAFGASRSGDVEREGGKGFGMQSPAVDMKSRPVSSKNTWRNSLS